MSDFGDFPPNMTPRNALVARAAEPAPQHAVVTYSADELARPRLGPANPFRDDTTALKRKNVPAGYAEETFISEHVFRAKHRAVERAGGPERELRTGAEVHEDAKRRRQVRRERKGDATVSEGDGAYVGPWARYRHQPAGEIVAEGEKLDSDEEYEIVDEDEDEGEDVIESGTVLRAPQQALARRKEVEELGSETTSLHVEEHDYLGRTYMHVPQDLDINLRKEAGSVENFIPKRQVWGWKEHTGAVTALRLFPASGHILLSSSADTTVRIWDVYHERSLLRTCRGHNRGVVDAAFSPSGDRFITASLDRTIKLWDTERGLVLGRFSTGKTPHVVRFNDADAAASGHEFLAGMSDNKIVQWDCRTGGDGDPVQTYDHHLAPVNTVEFYDGGRRFASTSDDRSVRCWEYGIPVPIQYVAEVDMFSLTRSARHPGGKGIAYQSGDNTVVVYRARDRFRQDRTKVFTGHNTAGSAVDISISPDGRWLASGDSAGFLHFWDWRTKKRTTLRCGDEAQTCLQWHPQETSKLVSGGIDGQIRYWD